MSKSPPKWIMRHADKCKQAFGLHDWDVHIRTVANIGKLPKDGKSGRVMGQHDTVYKYWSTVIQLVSDLPNDEYGTKIITHEMLHVALIEFDIALQELMGLIPRKHHDLAEYIFYTAQEHTIERLARSLTPMLRAVERGKDDK